MPLSDLHCVRNNYQAAISFMQGRDTEAIAALLLAGLPRTLHVLSNATGTGHA